jgi:hypothetical protein
MFIACERPNSNRQLTRLVFTASNNREAIIYSRLMPSLNSDIIVSLALSIHMFDGANVSRFKETGANL